MSACDTSLPAIALICALLSAATVTSRPALIGRLPVMKAVAPADFSAPVAVAISGSPTIVSTALKSGFCWAKPTVLKARVKPSAVPASPAVLPLALASMSEVLVAVTVTAPPVPVRWPAPSRPPPSSSVSLMKAVAPLSTVLETSTPLTAVPPLMTLVSVALMAPVDFAATVTSPRAARDAATIDASARPETSLREKIPPNPVDETLPTRGCEPLVPPGTTLVASSFFQRAKSLKSSRESAGGNFPSEPGDPVSKPRSTFPVKSWPMYWYTAPFSPLPLQVSLRRILSPKASFRGPDLVVYVYSLSSASADLSTPLTEPVLTALAEAPTVVVLAILTESVAVTVTSVPETVFSGASIAARAAPLTRFMATMPETASASALAARAEAVTLLPSVASISPPDTAVALTAPVAVTVEFAISATACCVAGLPRLVPTSASSVAKPRFPSSKPIALKASWMPAARAEVVGGSAVPVVVPPVAAEPSPVLAGPLDSAVTCASTLEVIEPPVLALTETAPSVPVVSTVESAMRAVAAERMALVAITALTARAFEAEVWVPLVPVPLRSKIEVRPGTGLGVPVPGLSSAVRPCCSRMVATASTVASAFAVITALRSAETATLPALTFALPEMIAVAPPRISLRETMPPAEVAPEPVVLLGWVSPSPTRRQ
ncbi:hypothetical protein CHKEEEPN_1640 [Methylorubrum podarium]|nr:hypothetical protein CHKEEEPN_1640 [Methylorubrum podarium]